MNTQRSSTMSGKSNLFKQQNSNLKMQFKDFNGINTSVFYKNMENLTKKAAKENMEYIDYHQNNQSGLKSSL